MPADGSLRRVDDDAEAAMAVFGAVTITGLHYLVAEDRIPADAAAEPLSLLLVDRFAPRTRR